MSCGNDMDRKRCPRSLRSIGKRKIALASQCAIKGRIGNELFEHDDKRDK